MSANEHPRSDTLYVLDSYGLIYRAYYAFINRPLVNDRGENVSAVFGFFRNFQRILKDYKPQFAVAAFDSKTPTFRHKQYAEYKANRQKTPPDLHAQIPVIGAVLEALGIPVISCDGYEADDVIATLAAECKKTGRPCRILSGDKDLMQLVDDSIHLLKPDKTGGWELIDEAGVQSEWGVPPGKMLDLLSLTGDASDNVPGVAGIGEKSAVKLLSEYGSLEAVFENAEAIAGSMGNKIRAGKDAAFFSRSLIALCETVPIDTDIEKYALHSTDFNAAALALKNAGVPAVAKTYAEMALTQGNVPPSAAGYFPANGVTPAQGESAADSGTLPEAGQNDVNSVRSGIGSTGTERRFGSPYSDEYESGQLTENKGDYKAVTSAKELAAIIDGAIQNGEVAFDCETDSLQSLTARMVGFSLSAKKGCGVYIPLITPDSGTLLSEPLISLSEAIRELNRLFSRQDLRVITHNGKFDYVVLRSNGLQPPRCLFADTMIAAWVLNPERASYSLEALAESHLKLKTTSFESLVPKSEKGMTFADVPLEKAVSYAAEDADLTWQLWQLFKTRLREQNLEKLFTDIEMPILPILAEMEIAGIHIEKQKLAEYGTELAANIEKAQKAVFELVGHEFNIASTKQLQEVLFTERKLTPVKKTKTGFSTDTAVLEELSAIDPVPQKILEYRTLSKLLSTYVETLPQLADAQGRVHTSFMQTGTATGRLSSRDPNLQNIPIRDEAGRRIREAFASKDGFALVSADYSQIELVILAHLSGDSNLQKAFIEGADVHRATAALIFGVTPEQVTPDMRRTAKTINFGVMYGMSPFRLSGELGISRTQAKEFIDRYFTTYSGVRDFIGTLIENAETAGYVETIEGRRRYIQAIASKNKTEKAAAERVAVNTPIQGSAADIVKKAMIALDKALKQEQAAGRFDGTRLLLQVHDELILETRETDAETVQILVKDTMESVAKLSIPLRVSVESGKNWGMFH